MKKVLLMTKKEIVNEIKSYSNVCHSSERGYIRHNNRIDRLIKQYKNL